MVTYGYNNPLFADKQKEDVWGRGGIGYEMEIFLTTFPTLRM